MSDIDEDEVVHIDVVGKRKVYSEAAYNRVTTERDRLREALEQAARGFDAIRRIAKEGRSAGGKLEDIKFAAMHEFDQARAAIQEAGDE